MADIILGPLVGGLTHQSANLWARANGEATLYGWYGKKADLSDAKLAGKVRLSSDTAFSAVVPLNRLSSSTRYFYTLTPKPAPPTPAREAGPVYPSFQTFPKPGEKASFSFSFGSCFLPGKAGGGVIFDALDKHRAQDNLSFTLLLGDQIYADPPEYNGLGHAAITLDDYRQVYLHTWSNAYFRKLLGNLPAFMILDDHEVDNDWHWDSSVRRWAHLPLYERVIRWIKRRPLDELFLTIHRVRDAMQAYWEHQGIHAPEYVKLPKMDAAGRFMFHEDDGFFAYTFQCGAVPFFVLDMRTMRVENPRERYLLGEPQWQALEKWLLDQRDAPVKFLVSSSSVLFDMVLDVFSDRWGGFPKERRRLLQFIADNQIENVYLLSGDIHSAHAIRADLRGPAGQDVTLHEFCSSPFEQTPNLVAFTRIPIFSSIIKRQKLYWYAAQCNFGVVHVDMGAPGKAQVTFSVYDQRGEQLKTIST